MKLIKFFSVASLLIAATASNATSLTITSPTTGGTVVPGITEVGGIVVDLIGVNNSRVSSQLSASSLFEGFSDDGDGNPLTIGTQSGFDATVLSALGGGIQQAAFRFTLDDGDSGAGDFDDGTDNSLLVNGFDFGFWSAVTTENTDGLGNAAAGGISTGFRDSLLDTGWFFSNDSTLLLSLFNSITSTSTIVFALNDVDPDDNHFDFTQGVDGSLINVGQGPTVTPPTNAVPIPAAVWLMGSALLGLFGFKRKSV